MAAVANGHTNGINGHSSHGPYERFADVPDIIDVPFENDLVNIDTTQEIDDIEELCDLLKNEHVECKYWVTIALAYVKQGHAANAIDILKRAAEVMRQASSPDRLSILLCLAWIYVYQSRRSPRPKAQDEQNKDEWLTAATTILNDASKINPAYPPLYLARGTVSLLRAALKPQERSELLRQASKCFDDAYRASNGKNILAILGKARVQFSWGKYADAYQLYQQVLERAPDMVDPDPRIGIGACLWQLGHKEHAKEAWERALQLNENSKAANVLLGLYHLQQTSQYHPNDPEFRSLYQKAMTTYTQTAFKLDDKQPLTCVTFGGYFLLRKTWTNVERLARRAQDYTDVSAVASDAWYLLARKEHNDDNLGGAADFYGRSDQARGNGDPGYVPAKFGIAQIKTLQQDFDGAKFQLEKMLSTNKSVEVMTLLGVLHAEDVFTSQAAGSKEDKTDARKKAMGLLEQVRVAWKDSKKKIQPDSAVLLNLARLYELDQPDKALTCLQQVEQMELDEISDDDLPEDIEDDEVAKRDGKRNMLSPQLLNNIACFFFQAEKLPQSREYFQSALRSSVSIQDKDGSNDTDALVSTISYNLARTYEAEGLEKEAEEIYNGLLARHPDYVDANTRRAYIALQTNPAEGAEKVKQLLDADPSNLEIRALYGWCLNKTKKKTLVIAEDQEQRHYKHTLMSYDKHDIYSLTGMGNLNLTVARDIPKKTDQHKERAAKAYMRAVEFFDKVLTLDPKNAFAAQGMAIALVEDKKDASTGIQILSKVRESIKDASVYINLGHVFCEMKQFSRSIENYELALQRSRDKDPMIICWLARAWFNRARAEKNIEYFKTSLDLSRQALEQSPDNVDFQWNVAYVQSQLAQQMISQPEMNKQLADVETAMQDLLASNKSFLEIAKKPNAPYFPAEIEQRAAMGNTMQRQLDAAIKKQAEYELKHKTRLDEARKRREEEFQKREEEKRLAEEKAEEEKRKVREERERMMEEDRQLIARRLEEDKAREEAEYTTDPDTGERKKRERKPKEKRQKRKKKGEDTDTDGVDGTGDEGAKRSRPRSRNASAPDSDGEAPPRKKKRRLERKGQAIKSSKYKSAETIEDSDEDDDAGIQPAARSDDVETPGATSSPAPDADDTMADEGDEDEEQVARPSQRKKPARILDDDEEDEEDAAMPDEAGAGVAGESDHGGD
ncbi:hypothetical protein M409DRAFT_70765 [Zasmidium cellare ATCC 36951]|uniref:TPR-like protein n=1 Tax=Zasmidium cellare ATCC 36951 TaxID=1080233 RepID=A0A6A6C0T1_ZASCE|nr:uncharacterized protein M409DRAFT_70765 [Zasmidium cellare ATCC 36951]KAF2159878.1 hypothetical protein M409DRAFT_70765 [Zasmidium cellare ATCC 36951]